MTRTNQNVLFVAGAGHSGSTLLGLCLGAHPSVFYAGEANKSLRLNDLAAPIRKRSCKVCGPECKVWSGLSLEPDLYQALSHRTGRSWVADSTKEVRWIEEQHAALETTGVRSQLIFVGRDGRAILASGLRKRPERSIEEHVLGWTSQLAATEELAASFRGPVHRVRYEALATRPEQVLIELTEALGLPFDRRMLSPFSEEQHPLGGNAGTQSLLSGSQTGTEGPLAVKGDKRRYYEDHPQDFMLDMRWKKELSAEALALIATLGGSINEAYAWSEESA